MIKNVVIHIANEQPLLADLFDMPTNADVSLVCSNVRMLDGKKPLFIDHANSVFVFPYQTIRFLEILATFATGLPTAEPEEPAPALTGELDNDEAETDLELDEDFLKRIRDV